MVPLKALISVADMIGPEQIERYNGYIAAKVFGNAKPGFSSGEAIAAVEAGGARHVLPPATPSNGRARPTRKSAPAARRSSPSASRS
jgi:multidrug efflux pump subunit AcrB